MSKMAEVFIKNMKIFLRDKKIIFIVFAIPIMLVLVMGFVFSGMSTGTNLSSYTIGYINMDLNSTVTPVNQYQSLNFVIGAITNQSTNNTNLFKLKNYTSTETNNPNTPDFEQSFNNAQNGMTTQDIVATLVFDAGFQQQLNDAVNVKVGFFDNDTTIYNGSNRIQIPFLIYIRFCKTCNGHLLISPKPILIRI